MTTVTKNQVLTFTKNLPGHGARIAAEVRYDDQCGNGHNTFSITGAIYENNREVAGGCIHKEIARHFPQLAPLIQWHLCSTDGPLYYVANTRYHADGHGPVKGWLNVKGTLAGEPVSGCRYGNLAELRAIAEKYPESCTLKVDEATAKERRLDLARASAIWPDATDEDLLAPGLESRLLGRLPDLLARFQAAIESLGLTY